MLPEWLMLEIVRSVLVGAHLLCFALAIYTLIASDYAVWTGRWSCKCFFSIGKWMKRYLLGLWLTGGSLLLVDYGLDLSELVGNSKSALKLTVVSVLTINGIFIHKIVFPIIQIEGKLTQKDARIVACVSTISTSHWLLAAFVGFFKPIVYAPLPYLLGCYVLFFATCAVMSFLMSPAIQTRINQKRAKGILIDLGLRESKNDHITLVGI